MTTNLPAARKPHVWLLFCAVFGLSLALRLHDLGLRPLWLDELFSDWFAARDWHYLWTVTPTFEVHAPFYYSLLKLWIRAFGDNEIPLRLLSVMFAQATLCLVFAAGRIAGDWRSGLLAAFFFACDKLQLFYAQDARPYAGFVFAMALALTGALWLVRHPAEAAAPPRQLFTTERRALAAYLALAAGLALLQWFQNLGLLFILPLAGFLVVWWFRRGARSGFLFFNLAGAALFALLLYAPFLSKFFFQLEFFGHGFWLQPPKNTWLTSQTIRLFGQSLDGMRPALRLGIWLLTIVPVAGLGFVRLWRAGEGNEKRWMLGLLLAASAGAWLFNVVVTYGWQPVFMERTLLPLQIAWFVLLSLVPFAFAGWRRTVILTMLMAVFLAGAGEYWLLKTTPPNGIERPWQQLVRIIAAQGPNVPVIAVPNHVEMALDYYERRQNVHFDIHPLPAPFPAVGDRYVYPLGGRAVPQITPDSVAAVMHQLAGMPKIWLVTHGATLDPRDEAKLEPERLIDRTLAADYTDTIVYRDRSATLILFVRKMPGQRLSE